jgi:hypothetical protein
VSGTLSPLLAANVKILQVRHLDLVIFLVDLMLRINDEDMFLCCYICGSDVTEITVSLKLLGSRWVLIFQSNLLRPFPAFR